MVNVCNDGKASQGSHIPAVSSMNKKKYIYGLHLLNHLDQSGSDAAFLENIEPSAQNKYITGSSEQAGGRKGVWGGGRKIIIFDLNLPCL